MITRQRQVLLGRPKGLIPRATRLGYAYSCGVERDTMVCLRSRYFERVIPGSDTR